MLPENHISNFKLVLLTLDLPDNGVAPVVDAAAPEAVFPEVEAVADEAMERRDEELLMYERSTAGSFSSSSSLDVETNHEGQRVWACNLSSRDLGLQ